MGRVPLVDARSTIRRRSEDIEAAIQRVLDRGVFTPDQEVAHLEAEFSTWLGVDHAIATGSGSAALSATLRALGIGRGARVAIAANLDISAVAPILLLGAKAVWIDIAAGTTVMCPDDLSEVIASVDAIVVVHTHGFVADMPRIIAMAKKWAIPVIEDITHAPGATHGRAMVGVWGNASVMSCAPTKPLGAVGSAGMAFTDDPNAARRIREFLAYGFDLDSVATLRAGAADAWYGYRSVGINGQPDELQAAVLRVQLTRLASDAQQRLRLHERMTRANHERIDWRPAAGSEGSTPAPRFLVVLTQERRALEHALSAAAVGSARHYVPSLHRHALLDDLSVSRSLPNTDRFDDEALCLPCGPTLTDADEHRIIRALSD